MTLLQNRGKERLCNFGIAPEVLANVTLRFEQRFYFVYGAESRSFLRSYLKIVLFSLISPRFSKFNVNSHKTGHA